MDNTTLLLLVFGGCALITYSQKNKIKKGLKRVLPFIHRLFFGCKTPPAPKWLKDAALRRAHYRCEKCGYHNRGALHVHHIIPRAKCGQNKLSNLIVLCPNCHSKAHARG
jgi:hypothetical protein